MLSEKMRVMESQLKALQHQPSTEAAIVEQQIDDLVIEKSILTVQLAEAESERQGMKQDVELVLWSDKELEQWIASLQQITAVSTQ